MINLPVSIRRALLTGFAIIVSLSFADISPSHAAQHLLSQGDLKAVSEATSRAGAGKLDAATTARDHIRDPLGRK